MTHAQFQDLKSRLKQRTAGAFIDAFYTFKDSPSSGSRNHRPIITVTCVFQRVPEGSSWTRPIGQAYTTPSQNLRLVQENPQAPRVPTSQLLPVEHHLGWSHGQINNFLTTIADIPLEFLCFVIYNKLIPAVESRAAANWASVILQPRFWRNQWMFYEVKDGRLYEHPRIVSRTYPYYRVGVSPMVEMPDYTHERDRGNWRKWQRPPGFESHLITLLRGLLMSDPEIVSVGYNDIPYNGVDLDLLNSPLSWNTIGNQAGSDLEYPGSSQLRNMDSVEFENGITVCTSTWYIVPNYNRIASYRYDDYWNRDHTGEIPAIVAQRWQHWETDFQMEWNDLFLHDFIFRLGRATNHEDFAGVNVNIPTLIAERNQTCYSLMRSRNPYPIPPRDRNASRVSQRLHGRGAAPIQQTTEGESLEASSLSDYIFMYMSFCN
jgi:hypothetical protein